MASEFSMKTMGLGGLAVASLAVFLLTLEVHGKALVDPSLHCGLDTKINIDTFPDYIGEIGNIFGAACGRNRGIFVIDPADGHTYNCAAFPEKWGVKDANAVKKAEPAKAVYVLNEFIKSVYMSSPEYVRARDPGACDFEAMSELKCGKELPWRTAPWFSKLNAPIRGVNLGECCVCACLCWPVLCFFESPSPFRYIACDYYFLTR